MAQQDINNFLKRKMSQTKSRIKNFFKRLTRKFIMKAIKSMGKVVVTKIAAFASSLLLPALPWILLAVLIVIMVTATINGLEEAWSKWVEDKEYKTSSHATEDWLKNEEESIFENNRYYDKEDMEYALELEKKTYIDDIDAGVKVSKEKDGYVKDYTGEEVVTTDISESSQSIESYTVELLKGSSDIETDGTYKYRFPWQFILATSNLDMEIKAKDTKHKLMEDIYSEFRTKYYYGLSDQQQEIQPNEHNKLQWKDFKYYKTETTKITKTKKKYDDEGNLIEKTKTYEEIIKKYPLPYFDKIDTFLTTYTYEYEYEDVVTTDTGTQVLKDTDDCYKTMKEEIKVREPKLKKVEVIDKSSIFVEKMKQFDVYLGTIKLIDNIIELFPGGEEVSNEFKKRFTLDLGSGPTSTPVPPGTKQNILTSLSNQPYSQESMLWPVPGYYNISSPFGYRIHPIYQTRKFHTGIDIPAHRGADVVAVNDGVVVLAGYYGGYGNSVMIDHGGNIATFYAHNHRILVQDGQEVKKGDVIATVGTTGTSTGNHLHFEVVENGQYLNPIRGWVNNGE